MNVTVPPFKPRTCGEGEGKCTLCCYTHAVSPVEGETFIRKSEHVWCTDCAIGVGCKVYKERPAVCRKFRCGWLNHIGADDERPDKVNFVMQQHLSSSGIVLRICESVAGAVDSIPAQRVMRERLSLGTIVMLCRKDERYTIHVPAGKNLTQEFVDAAARFGHSIERVSQPA